MVPSPTRDHRTRHLRSPEPLPVHVLVHVLVQVQHSTFPSMSRYYVIGTYSPTKPHRHTVLHTVLAYHDLNLSKLCKYRFKI